MIIPLKPSNESGRLHALKELDILDTLDEREFEEIVALASFICKTPMATITLIDENRQWFKAQRGLNIKETPRDVAFCAHAILQDEILVINDATKDLRFSGNPLVTGQPDIRFYAGMPLKTDEGYNLGTICVIDTQPRELSDEQSLALDMLRNQVLRLFELRKKNKVLVKMHELHQKLLSIVGHDLRAPINSIEGLLNLSESHELSLEEYQEMLPKMRMMVDTSKSLLLNLLEWTKSHIQGKPLVSETVRLSTVIHDITSPLIPILDQKANSLDVRVPDRLLARVHKHKFDFVIRNLVLNAHKFTEGGTISIMVKKADTHALVTVTDTGVGIDPKRAANLFEWGKGNSTRGTKGEIGSGLGLPMCREFVEEMGGTIWLEPREAGSAFSFTVPIDAAR
jgi:signal transduction histidine kinase